MPSHAVGLPQLRCERSGKRQNARLGDGAPKNQPKAPASIVLRAVSPEINVWTDPSPAVLDLTTMRFLRASPTRGGCSILFLEALPWPALLARHCHRGEASLEEIVSDPNKWRKGVVPRLAIAPPPSQRFPQGKCKRHRKHKQKDSSDQPDIHSKFGGPVRLPGSVFAMNG
jgi:hypothetical protein